MSKRAIFFDTETTGLKPDEERIVEIAAYDPERNAEFSTLVNPGRPIPPSATTIHNITDAMVAGAPPFSEVANRFVAFCGGDVALIAHNNDAFDQPFLEAEFRRNRIAIPQWPYIDSLKFARKYRPDLPSHSLQELRKYHAIAPNRAHRALDDVIILHRIFVELVDDLAIETIIELMEEKRTLHQMPFGKHKGKALRDVPLGYIHWLDANGILKQSSHAELRMSFEKLGMLPQTPGKNP